ncbi:glutamate ABC transporter substrate-binding protein [Nonomuraea sp. NPDC050536]|uniref:glutamate ABC transporter substrate-binding protein n=1 Tax=Nonomuraea sp. NPDC050536 TaxID=3364366 RepID=UPI0037C895C3
MKRLLPTLLVLVSLVAAGCGSGSPETIVGKEKLIVGVRPDLPLIGVKKKDGTFEGFDVDVARYLGKKLGTEIEFTPVLAAQRESALTSGKVDMVLASYTISQDRKAKVLFGGPYIIAYQDLLVRKDETGIDNVRDLKGRRICQVKGSNAAQRVIEERRVQAQVVPVADYNTCVQMLKSSQLDVITTDDVILAGLAATNDGLKLVNAKFNEQRTGIGLRKTDVEGCEAVNRAITDMYQDGTAARLLHRWFDAAGLSLTTIAVPQFEGCS